MTTSSNNQFLLLCTALIISAAVLCHGEPVIDSDGNEVSTGSMYVILKADSGFKGGLAPMLDKGCQSNVFESPTIIPEQSVFITPGYTSDFPIPLQINSRNRFSFFLDPFLWLICNGTADWFIGDDEHDGSIDFLPIIAGQIPYSEKPPRASWFEVRSTGEEGVYKLAACNCLPCRNLCPEVGAFTVDGKTVLGIGGETYLVRFVKAPTPFVPPSMRTAQQ